MTLAEQRALLVAFCDWWRDGWVQGPWRPGTDAIDNFLATLPQPLESLPLLPVDPAADALVDGYRATACQCGHRRDEHMDWTANAMCRKCGCQKFTLPMVPYCIHGHLSAEGQCPECGAPGGCSHRNVAVGAEHIHTVNHQTAIGYPAKVATREELRDRFRHVQVGDPNAQPICGNQAVGADALRALPCSCSHCEVERERDQPARFWRVAPHTRGYYYAPCDARGVVLDGRTVCLRGTREEAEADGAASGLQRWEEKP